MYTVGRPEPRMRDSINSYSYLRYSGLGRPVQVP